jgi:translation initiation factor IF-2
MSRRSPTELKGSPPPGSPPRCAAPLPGSPRDGPLARPPPGRAPRRGVPAAPRPAPDPPRTIRRHRTQTARQIAPADQTQARADRGRRRQKPARPASPRPAPDTHTGPQSNQLTAPRRRPNAAAAATALAGARQGLPQPPLSPHRPPLKARPNSQRARAQHAARSAPAPSCLTVPCCSNRTAPRFPTPPPPGPRPVTPFPPRLARLRAPRGPVAAPQRAYRRTPPPRPPCAARPGLSWARARRGRAAPMRVAPAHPSVPPESPCAARLSGPCNQTNRPAPVMLSDRVRSSRGGRERTEGRRSAAGAGCGGRGAGRERRGAGAGALRAVRARRSRVWPPRAPPACRRGSAAGSGPRGARRRARGGGGGGGGGGRPCGPARQHGGRAAAAAAARGQARARGPHPATSPRAFPRPPRAHSPRHAPATLPQAGGPPRSGRAAAPPWRRTGRRSRRRRSRGATGR